MNKPLILVVEDDNSVKNLITTTLKAHDYRFLAAQNGASAILEASSHNPDIVLLDLGLPDIDGVEVIKKIRSWSNMPIIVISARSEDSDKIDALDAGADDYLTKPFYREELIMRVKALLKRSLGLFDENVLKYKDISCDLKSYEVLYKEQVLPIQGKEFELLVYFLQNKGIILTKEQIFDRIWGFDSDTTITVIEVYMSNLRKHLRSTGLDKEIKTLRNVGYILQRV